MFKPHWARGLVEDDVGTDEREATRETAAAAREADTRAGVLPGD